MTGVVPDNHVLFGVGWLSGIFASCMGTLAYVDATSAYVCCSRPPRQRSVRRRDDEGGSLRAASATLDLGNAADRAQLFALLEAGIAGLEGELGYGLFAARTLTGL